MLTSTFFLNSIHQAIVQKIDLPNLVGVEIYIKREDLLHPYISGNKFRKLKYNIQAYQLGQYDGMVTLGGPYSNHIAATAYAGKEFGIPTHGIIRGEEQYAQNHTLQKALQNGMRLHFVDRNTYRNLCDQENPDLSTWIENSKKMWFIPEGGANTEGFKGCQEILEDLNDDFEYVICPCGTGSTLAGMISNPKKDTNYIGISVLKGDFMQAEVEQILQRYASYNIHTNWKILENYHRGGYGKTDHDLLQYIDVFTQNQKIALDPIYTGKMMMAVSDLLEKTYFRPNSKVLCIHTGGLQGIKPHQVK